MNPLFSLVCSIVIACCSIVNGYTQVRQLNIPALHQLIAQSEKEYDRQKDARQAQALVYAKEKINLSLIGKTKDLYRKIQDRYHLIGLLVDIAEMGLHAEPMLEQVIAHQKEIVRLAGQDPALIAMGYQAQLRFADQANGLVRYLAGLCLSAGDLNQLRASDRKVLFDHALQELGRAVQLSGRLLASMQYATTARQLGREERSGGFVSTDIAIAKGILQNAQK